MSSSKRKWSDVEDLNDHERNELRKLGNFLDLHDEKRLLSILHIPFPQNSRRHFVCPVDGCFEEMQSPLKLIRHIFRCEELTGGYDYYKSTIDPVARWCSTCGFIYHTDVYFPDHDYVPPCPYPHCRKQWRRCETKPAACTHDDDFVKYSQRAYDTGIVMAAQLYCNMPEDIAKIVLQYM